MNIFFNVIYYLLFLCFGIVIVIFRDALAAKLVESRKLTGFLVKNSIVNEVNEIIYAKRLTLGLGLFFIAFGFFKAFESIVTFLR